MIPARIRALYRRSFREPRRERLFLASASFLIGFAVTRIITHLARAHGDHFFSVHWGDTHVHHLVWGIMLLLLVGYLALIQGGNGNDLPSLTAGRIAALLYGLGAALTLDEFALWLNLEDVYWENQGRASIDAVMLFGALISMGFWGGPFLRATGRQLARLLRRHPAPPRDAGARGDPGGAAIGAGSAHENQPSHEAARAHLHAHEVDPGIRPAR
jgi:hypothetical protein